VAPNGAHGSGPLPQRRKGATGLESAHRYAPQAGSGSRPSSREPDHQWDSQSRKDPVGTKKRESDVIYPAIYPAPPPGVESCSPLLDNRSMGPRAVPLVILLLLAACTPDAHRLLTASITSAPTYFPANVLSANATLGGCISGTGESLRCPFDYRVRITNPTDHDAYVQDCRTVTILADWRFASQPCHLVGVGDRDELSEVGVLRQATSLAQHPVPRPRGWFPTSAAAPAVELDRLEIGDDHTAKVGKSNQTVDEPLVRDTKLVREWVEEQIRGFRLDHLEGDHAEPRARRRLA
jgi:hypothetical protein